MTDVGYLAHSANDAGYADPLREHVRLVACRSARYAESFGVRDEAFLAGLLHDLGKYGERFQRRLHGQEHGIDHWSAGAWEALTAYRALNVAAAIQGHHIGLQRMDKTSLRALDPAVLVVQHPLGLRLSSADPSVLHDRLRAEVAVPAPSSPPPIVSLPQTAAAMLDVRMLFSVLVDADFLETEAHFGVRTDGTRVPRPDGLPLEPERALVALRERLADVQRSSPAAEHIRLLRQDLLSACLKSARSSPGLFTLSAPTGSGKTLAMLAFALQHAVRWDMRRIIVVIPYLSIIEQTAGEYRKALAPILREGYILEHHSLADARGEEDAPGSSDKDNEDEARRARRLLAENWDAPLIVTTSVQFLESLFANVPSACRKLHRLAGSVILFDEVQTLPTELAVPTLATLSHLSRRYRVSVVFATATQPAFDHLDRHVSNLNGEGSAGWQPSEIAPPRLRLFERAKRTKVQLPALDGRASWGEIAARLAGHDQVICIVNKKAHAKSLVELLQAKGADGLFHLSTSMCPAHRQEVLARARAALDAKRPCRLISTQCVEAGVDVDFPVAYRAWGPLEAIAQAAGRCNRNGRADYGDVFVFLPELPSGGDAALYPDGAYRRAADVAAMLLERLGPDRLSLDDPAVFDAYYRELYAFARPEEGKKGLLDAIRGQDFVKVAEQYRLIPKNTINVLVCYDVAAYKALAAEVRQKHLTADWIRRARPHTVSLYRPCLDSPVRGCVEPVPVGRRGQSEEWFIYLFEEDYDRDLLGLLPPDPERVLLA